MLLSNGTTFTHIWSSGFGVVQIQLEKLQSNILFLRHDISMRLHIIVLGYLGHNGKGYYEIQNRALHILDIKKCRWPEQYFAR